MPESDLLLSNEPAIRLGVFLGVLVAMAIWEVAAPRRRIEIPRVIRWTNNLGVVIVDTILVRLVYPIAAVGLALWAEQKGWGKVGGAIRIPEGPRRKVAVRQDPARRERGMRMTW